MTDEPDVRIGTAEREAAQQELNDHFSQGRLEMAEFEDRSSRVSAARTRSELESVFQDLPHTAAVAKPAGSPAQRPNRNWRYTVVAAMPITAVILFFILGALKVEMAWLVFLLIPLAGVVFGGGEYRMRDRRRRYERRRDRYDD